MSRRQRSGVSLSSLGSIVVLLLSLLEVVRKEWLILGVIWVLIFALWLAFFKQTQCDVETDKGTGCGNPAHGRLRACHLIKHKRAKRDALWRIFRLNNPAIRYRIMWTQPRLSYGHVSPQVETSPPRIMKPLYDSTILIATVVGAAATVAALALQIHSIG
jgi:Ca2+/Na+ antiporter